MTFSFLAKNDAQMRIILFLKLCKTHIHNEKTELYESLHLIFTVLYTNAIHILQSFGNADFRQLKIFFYQRNIFKQIVIIHFFAALKSLT